MGADHVPPAEDPSPETLPIPAGTTNATVSLGRVGSTGDL